MKYRDAWARMAGPWQRWYDNTRLKNKLIVFFSVITLISVSVVGGTSYFITRQHLMEGEQRSLTQSMWQLSNTVEYFFEVYLNKSEMLFTNTELQKAITKENKNIVDVVQTHKTIERILRQITDDIKYPALRNSYYFGGTLKVSLYTDNPTLSPDGAMILSSADVAGESWYQALYASPKLFAWESDVTDKNGTRFICLNRRMFDFSTTKDMGVLKVYIPIERLINVIQSNAEYSNKLLLYVDGAGRVIASHHDGGATPGALEMIPSLAARQGAHEYRLNGINYIIGNVESAITGWRLIYAVPTHQIMGKVRIILTVTLVTALLSIALCVVFSSLIAGFITKRIATLVGKTNLVASGDLRLGPALRGNDEIGQLDKNFNGMVRRINDLIENEYKWALSLNKIQLELLQEQINPHMLYNSLAMISMQAKNSGNEAITETSDHLIAFYRGILNRGQVETTIGEEIETLLVYIQITKAVYGLDIETVMEVEEEIMDCRAIKLFLQPIVENAVVHGIRPVQSGVIVITGQKKTGRLEFTVSDNGVGMKPEVMEKLNRLSTGDSPAQFYGISNVVRRIKLFYGEEYGVRFSALAEGGTVASVAIPVLDGDQMKQLLAMPYMAGKGGEKSEAT